MKISHSRIPKDHLGAELQLSRARLPSFLLEAVVKAIAVEIHPWGQGGAFLSLGVSEELLRSVTLACAQPF